jgi:hypothetical protein
MSILTGDFATVGGFFDIHCDRYPQVSTFYNYFFSAFLDDEKNLRLLKYASVINAKIGVPTEIVVIDVFYNI